jgi:hypothetical protein
MTLVGKAARERICSKIDRPSIASGRVRLAPFPIDRPNDLDDNGTKDSKIV